MPIRTPEICPICGDYVPEKAKACPNCGACHETGWSEEAKADILGIPREDFDYNQFVEEEFEEKKPARTPMIWLWWLVALLLLAIIIAGVIPRF